MADAPSLPKGTRDFGPDVMQKREYIFDTIKSVFRLHGFQPLETPSMENLSTLLGKYGEEGDKLLFRVLNSGDFLSKVPDSLIQQENNSKKITPYISEKGLRYDLTVPFARFVVLNRNDIQFPFKRYQIQPVWRADRPQKGRYREFYQCDVDVIGSMSMLNEFELIQIIDRVFKKLKMNVVIHINNRKVLDGILQSLEIQDKLAEVAIAIDKLDKTDEKTVHNELVGKGIPSEKVQQLLSLISVKASPKSVLELIQSKIGNTISGAAGLSELEEVYKYISSSEISTEIVFDLSLARGLDYYTGAIFEVKAKDVSMGSICGGGRYDNLTAFFGLPDMSGVGVSFGADRIYDVMTELNLFPESVHSSTKVMIVNFGCKETDYVLPLLSKLRNNHIPSELYPDADKMKKQMNYANKKSIPFVIIAGENEMTLGNYTLKNMLSGEQQVLSSDEIITNLTKSL